jgi:hypothetical protein
MAGTLKLNDTDLKSAIIAIVIAGGGALYWRWKKANPNAGANPFNAGANINSAASGSAGAIAPSSSINTYNVFPTVSAQSGSPNSFFNGPASNVSPTSIHSGSTAWLSNGQGFSLPVKT